MAKRPSTELSHNDVMDTIAFLQDAGLHVTEAQAAQEKELVILAGPGGGPGARRDHCSECARVVWLSPRTQAMLAERGSKPYSIRCTDCNRELAEVIRELAHALKDESKE